MSPRAHHHRQRSHRSPSWRTVLAALAAGVLFGAGAHLLVTPPIDATALESFETGPGNHGRVEVAGRVVTRSGEVPAPIVDAAVSSVLRVTTVGCGTHRSASAVQVLTDQGRSLLLTAAHVVGGATEAVVSLPDGTERTVSVLGAIHGVDAALLASPSDPAVDPLPLGPAAEAGDPVVVAGHPDGEARLDRTSIIGSETRVAPGGMAEVFLTASTVWGGHSGGAVLDIHGRVVGLVVARDPVTGAGVAHPVRDVLASSLVATPDC